jgi:uncharacterized protein
MKNIAIIYHDADFDGKLSNEACRFHLKLLNPDATIHSYGWDYGRPVPVPLHAWFDPQLGDQFSNEWSLYDAIYIVDLSVDELMARPELRDKIVWIDHHKSAIEKWDNRAGPISGNPVPNFQGIRIDGVAACRLCWAWFTWDVGQEHLPPLTKSVFVDREIKEPRLIRLAGEYDIWDDRDPDAKVLQFGLRALSETDLGRLVENQFSGEPTGVKLDDVITQGRAIKSYCDKQNDEYSASYSHTIKWEGLTFCALNIGQRGNSDLLKGGIRPEHDACFAWRYTGNGYAMVSLYHIAGKEHHDLSKIAVKCGGGGHKGACGFRITLLELHEILG